MLNHNAFLVPHKFHGLSFNKIDRVSLALCGLYETYGFTKFSMNKFEPYDLYSGVKDFLVSENILTFTDLDGSLLALKPDVTLSIIKNTQDIPNLMQKFYYNENVYRAAKDSNSFKEIRQIGLESLGKLDFCSVHEVMELACKSLLTISDDAVFLLSDMRIINAIIDGFDVSQDIKDEIFEYITSKNTHELQRICEENKVDDTQRDALFKLVNIDCRPSETFGDISEIFSLYDLDKVCGEFMRLAIALEEEFESSPLEVKIDFSATNEIKYYNAIVFKGYIKGISSSVISGGEYGSLMEEMGRQPGAIGFACYLDLLSELDDNDDGYDVDTLIIYNATDDFENVSLEARRLREAGECVLVLKTIPEGIKYRHLINFETI